MIFSEVAFFLVFLLPTACAFHLAPARARPWVIVAGGVGFFTYFGWLHFGGAWGALAVLIFVWELLTSRLYKPGSRWCLFGIAQAVAILAAFKYLPFLCGAWDDASRLSGLFPPLHGTVRLVLPLGVSFFTFEFIHYAADVYWGKIRKSGWGQYASFIFFFPTMVAGPIKRYQEFVPQIERAKFRFALSCQGVARIGMGLAKKVVLADSFGLWSDQLNTPALATASPLAVAGWILAYGGKIYFDFSGYSDIAIGSGNLFGVSIPENFNWPYLATSSTEFWRRWHISFSRWIMDYVFMPLQMRWRDWGVPGTALALVATFSLSGLWHGAAYNFVLWGLWHGLLLVGHRLWRNAATPRGWAVPRPVAILVTFVLVNAGWALFCMDLPTAALAARRILGMP